jgi:hypothetical protein
MWMSAKANTVGRYLHFEIVGPSFPKGINSTGGNFYLAPGTSYTYLWGFPVGRTSGEYLDVGNYSGILWRWLGGTKYTKVAQITWQII